MNKLSINTLATDDEYTRHAESSPCTYDEYSRL